jgi:hypothetical protein
MEAPHLLVQYAVFFTFSHDRVRPAVAGRIALRDTAPKVALDRSTEDRIAVRRVQPRSSVRSTLRLSRGTGAAQKITSNTHQARRRFVRNRARHSPNVEF